MRTIPEHTHAVAALWEPGARAAAGPRLREGAQKAPDLQQLHAQLVAQQPDAAYTLTDLGRGVYQALRPLVRWSNAWAAALSEDGKD